MAPSDAKEHTPIVSPSAPPLSISEEETPEDETPLPERHFPVPSAPIGIEHAHYKVVFYARDVLPRDNPERNPELIHSLRRIENRRDKPDHSIPLDSFSFNFEITIRNFFLVHVFVRLALIDIIGISYFKEDKKILVAGENRRGLPTLERLYHEASPDQQALIIPLFDLKSSDVKIRVSSPFFLDREFTPEERENDERVLTTITRETEKMLIDQRVLPSQDDLNSLRAIKDNLLQTIVKALEKTNPETTTTQTTESKTLGDSYDELKATQVLDTLSGNEFQTVLAKVRSLFELAKTHYTEKTGFFSSAFASFFGSDPVLSSFREIGARIAQLSSSQQDEKVSYNRAARGPGR